MSSESLFRNYTGFEYIIVSSTGRPNICRLGFYFNNIYLWKNLTETTLPNFAQIEPQMLDLLKPGRRGCFDFALKIPKKQTGNILLIHLVHSAWSWVRVFFFVFLLCVNVMYCNLVKVRSSSAAPAGCIYIGRFYTGGRVVQTNNYEHLHTYKLR